MRKKYFLVLLSKRLTGELSSGEEEKLQQAMEQDEEYKRIAGELIFYFQSKNENQLAADDKLQKAWEQITEVKNPDRDVSGLDNSGIAKHRFFAQNLLRAAAILIPLIAGIAIWYLFNQRQPVSFATLSSSHQKIFKTLDDGTRIWLRQGSTIRYNDDFGKSKREMFLSGEAFFEVAKNRSIPLFLHAGSIDIEVKGTSFNVIADQEHSGVEVSLIRGLVEITDNLNKDRSVLLKPMQKFIFSAGRLSDSFHIINLAPAQQLQDIKWTIDSLVFKKERLEDLAVQMERKYQVKIQIQTEKLKNKRFSGVLRDELLTEALDALKLSYPFTYTIKDSLVIIK
jgi:ferric-dicitrate binding protein FerR (iron transport regulator)